MDAATLSRCELLIDNRDRVKKVFHIDEGVIHLACASIYTSKGKTVDIGGLKEAKSLIKQHTSVINNFRSYGFSCIAAMIASSDDAETTLVNGLQIYKMLKELFFTSEYLPFAAMSIAQMAKPEDFQRIVTKTRSIYNRMKAEHWFLTGADDSGLCALMALSEKSEDALIADAELCYRTLKPSFFSGSAVQSLSHVLALSDTDPEDACARTMKLFDQLKAAGRKYGTYYELATLGVLAMTNMDYLEVVNEMLEVDDWLRKQKGFGVISSVTKKQRLMYAGMMVQQSQDDNDSLQSAAINSMISMMIAEEVAMYCAICATSTAVASSNAASAH